MSQVDTRQLSRDSLFLLARLRVEGDPRNTEYRVKVRNLSAGGVMAEGDVGVVRGSLVSLELRNIGWVDGAVAWKQDNRFGIAFAREIDHKRVLAAPSGSDADLLAPRYARPSPATGKPEPSKLRKL